MSTLCCINSLFRCISAGSSLERGGRFDDSYLDGVDDEKTPLIRGTAGEKSTTLRSEDIKVYSRRWYVLFLFCLCSFLQVSQKDKYVCLYFTGEYGKDFSVDFGGHFDITIV